MDDNVKKIVKVAGYLLLAYVVITARVVSIAATDGHNSRTVIGTNFWSFYPLDSASSYCDRNQGTDMSLGNECTDQVSKQVAKKWLITLTESDKPDFKL